MTLAATMAKGSVVSSFVNSLIFRFLFLLFLILVSSREKGGRRRYNFVLIPTVFLSMYVIFLVFVVLYYPILEEKKDNFV